jgi:LysR family transcriptional regulator, glycine cleavage system transcriptional activator
MTRTLKHLNALRAVEASARLGNFTRAAEELGVTPAAVGQQVRILEGYLERTLFHRTPGGLRTTAAAVPALSDLHAGFDRLEAGFKRLRGLVAENQLSVSVAPALAWKWLAPRMQGLYERCPQIDLRMDTSLRLADIAGGEFDLAIRYGAEERDGLKTIPLLQEYLLPVCAPSLSQASAGTNGAATVLDLPLLHIEGETSDAAVRNWRHWGELFGLHDRRLDHGPRYPQSAMALQAALDGQGVALCGLTLVIDDLVAGTLVAPFRPVRAVRTAYAYGLVYSPVRHQSATQRTFMRWIEQEAQDTRERISRYLSRAEISLTG